MTNPNKTERRLTFYGQGSQLFGISIVNAILTVLTLGLYYPWAKTKKLHYLYHEMEFEGSRFEFHGKGSEVFKGFLKLLGLIILFIGVTQILPLVVHDISILLGAVFCMYVVILFFIPLAIHGSVRYRLSRTSWRGIHFGYRGDRKELMKIFFKGILLCIPTFGIYGSWLAMNMRRYIFSNIRFGNITFSYKGEGGDYFWLQIKGNFLTVLTLGIYLPWYMQEITDFYVDNIRMKQGETKLKMNSTVTGGGYFKLFFVNLLIVVFTLGFGMPWAIIRTMRYIASNISVIGDLDTENIVQTEEDYKDATGDDLADFLEIDLI